MKREEEDEDEREIVVPTQGFISRYLPAIIAIVTGAGSAFAMLQVQQVQIEDLQEDIREHQVNGHPMLYSRTLQEELRAHIALPGHAGVIQRIESNEQQLRDHQKIDEDVRTALLRRIEKIEDRILELERTLRRAKETFQLSKEKS